MSSERLDLSLPLCPRVWCLGRTWQPRRVCSTPVLSTLTLSVLNTALLQQHFSDGASAHTSITFFSYSMAMVSDRCIVCTGVFVCSLLSRYFFLRYVMA